MEGQALKKMERRLSSKIHHHELTIRSHSVPPPMV